MRRLSQVDVALLPIGGTYTMDMDDAVRAARAIKVAAVIPMHHLKADPREFKKKIEAKSDIRGLPLRIGGVYRMI
jgi:L-ascorbate metabolism protein UlaG (beta-lactamase superfamily)